MIILPIFSYTVNLTIPLSLRRLSEFTQVIEDGKISTCLFFLIQCVVKPLALAMGI